MDRKRATLTGLAAILLWSTMVGLIRSVSEGLGPVGGAAMIYTVSGLLCLVTVGFPDLRRFSTRYLIAGSILFVSYEMCLALSLGYAATRSQAIEVGMVNYLWPSLTIAFAILFNGQKTTLWVIPGLLISLLGVCWVLGGENGLQLNDIMQNVVSSPLVMGWRLLALLSGPPTAPSPASMPKGKWHYPFRPADRPEPVGQICRQRSARNGVQHPGCGEAIDVWGCAWLWLRRLEYRYSSR